MKNLNKKLQLNKENIATLDNMDQIYGGDRNAVLTLILCSIFCSETCPPNSAACSAACPPQEGKCTHSGCSCC